MRKSRALIGVTGLALAATSALAGTGSTAAAEPGGPTPAGVATDGGRGAGTARSVAPLDRAELVRRAAESAVSGERIDMPAAYPYQPELKVYRDNADDAAHTAELLGHPELAPRLMDLMAVSDRISVQVVGRSTEGRDLYLVTLTAPETAEETAQQAAWRTAMKEDPEAAAADPELLAGYKTPIWISNNIHGNEWEGTDAAMQYIEYLATAPIAEVRSILANNRVYFSPSLNPDGRTNATRATALGLDPNRDMITNTTPETKSFIRTAQAIQPIYAADFHGYTSVLQMEPCGPPHGSNYEYDLTMPHNYALALKVEKDVVDAAIPGNTYYNTATRQVVAQNTGADTAHIKIPYRDTPDGWDDFPPIFTAQYAAFYGAASATVELPKSRALTVNGTSRQSPANAVINTAVALQTMKSIVGYLNVQGNATDMIRNQIETFRRGNAGEPKDNLTTADVASVPGPTQWRALWDVVDDQEPVDLPRAYVIPVGEGQRSDTDAARLVEQLIAHDLEVGTLTAATTVDGTTYPKGSYVVDMHQPLRGLANSLLDLGDDISAKVPSMYDISAWSYSYTWGATVAKVGSTLDGPIGAVLPIEAVPAPASPTAPAHLTFDVAGVADYRLLNRLLEDDVPVSMLADGSAVVGRASYAAAVAAAADLEVALEPASAADLAALDDDGTKALSDLTVAYAGSQDDRLSLTELGFDDLVPASVAALNTTPGLLEDVDVLWIGGAFNPAVDSAAENAVEAFVAEGGAVVGKENAGNYRVDNVTTRLTDGAFTFLRRIGLLDGTSVMGNGSGNGIVAVDTPAGSVLAPYAQDSAFIYPAYSFADLGDDVTVEQTYDAVDPLLAGHWRATDGTNGPGAAAGNASAVSTVDEETGARAFVFGTSPFFRTHPKGGLSQAARALFWAGPEGTDVVAPQGTTATVAPIAPVTYPGSATVTVTTAAGDAAAVDGTVELVSGTTVLARGVTTAGALRLSVPGLTPGSTQVTARFTPWAAGYDPSVSAPATITVAKAASSLGLKAVRGKTSPKARTGKVKVTVSLAVPGVATSGRVVLRVDGKARRTLSVAAGGSKVLTLTLKKGRHTIAASYAGSELTTAAGAAAKVTLR